MVKFTKEISSLPMSKCAILVAKMIGDGTSKIQFHDFQSFGYNIPQCSIKIIGMFHLLESNTLVKLVSR